MSDEIAARLRAGLEGTTPGEWTRRDTPDYAEIVAPDQRQPTALVGSPKDADHIANCSPENIRALLDERDRIWNEYLAERTARMEANAREYTERQIAEAVELRVTQQEYFIEEQRQRLEAAEAELARLRAQLTRHDWVVSSLQDISDEGISDVIDEACRCLERQAARIAEVEAKYSLSCQIGARIEEERDAAEASLREAREAMEGVAEIAVTSTGPGYAAIFHRARAWLAKRGDKL